MCKPIYTRENKKDVIKKNDFTLKYISAEFSLTWYQSLDDQTVTSSNLTIPIYLIKIKHKVMWACTSFKPKGLSLEGVC